MNPGIFSAAFYRLIVLVAAFLPLYANGQQPMPNSTLLENLLLQSPALSDFLQHKDSLGIQVIYTQVDRTKKGNVKFTDHFYHVDPARYFYPASTVKFPVAILALQKLNELKIAGLDRNSTMITEAAGEGQTAVNNDPSAADGRPTIAHYIRKILLVSDNDAFNRLYEFLGQEYINESLHRMGYTEAEIVHRLSVSLTEEQNRLTNPIRFLDTAGNLLLSLPARRSDWNYAPRTTRLGTGYMKGNTRVNEPFDFSQKNRLALPSLHSMLKAVMFPEAVSPQQRFNLTEDDHRFLRQYMSMRPGESVSPVYDTAEFWDNYVKMIFYGTGKTAPLPGIRIFNKTGTAYGFLIETAYIADFDKQVEFMVSAVIYCNSDGVFNDDHYDYDEVGYPFLKTLGRVLYESELKRERKHRPDLSAFRLKYP